jgi:hypothetical protein
MAEIDYITASSAARAQLALHVERFEQLVSEHSDRLRRIERLLDELAADKNSAPGLTRRRFKRLAQ